MHHKSIARGPTHSDRPGKLYAHAVSRIVSVDSHGMARDRTHVPKIGYQFTRLSLATWQMERFPRPIVIKVTANALF